MHLQTFTFVFECAVVNCRRCSKPRLQAGCRCDHVSYHLCSDWPVQPVTAASPAASTTPAIIYITLCNRVLTEISTSSRLSTSVWCTVRNLQSRPFPSAHFPFLPSLAVYFHPYQLPFIYPLLPIPLFLPSVPICYFLI